MTAPIHPLRLLTLLTAALWLVACSAPSSKPLPEVPWLDRFEARPETTEPAIAWTQKGQQSLAPDRSHAILKADSRRQSLVTDARHSWQTTLDLDAPGALVWSTISLKQETISLEQESAALQGTSASIEWHTETSRELLWQDRVGDTWQEKQIALPTGPGTLRLVSGGAVAWAELHGSPEKPASREASATGERPNLVLISIDTVRSDHLSTYGYGRPTSPELDRLAAESWLFERSFSASTWTLPSTASMLSGLMPSQHGLRSLHDRLPERIDTLAERLRRLGYRTAAFTDGGFASPNWGLAQGFERYDVTPGDAWVPKDVAVITEQASRWLRHNHRRPYFLFLHTYETHRPYTNSEGFAEPFADPDYNGPFQHVADIHPNQVPPLTEADLRQVVALYDGEIRRADHYLGRLLEQMRQATDWQRTAVLVTSDHGEELMEHGDFEHGFGKVFDVNVRVPFILKPPHNDQGSAVGQRFSMPVSGLDVVPTLLTLADGPLDPAMVGRSLVDARGRVDPRQAPILVHGINSFHDANEERLRLDQAGVAVIFDRVRERVDWYDMQEDPLMQQPRSPFDGAAAEGAAQRLQGILGWMHDGTLAVRLADDLTAVRIPAGSKIAPLGVWDGWLWHAAPQADRQTTDGWQPRLTPGQSHYLVFTPRPGAPASDASAGWYVETQRAAPAGDSAAEDSAAGDSTIGTSNATWTSEPLTVDASRPFTWHPFGSDLPPVGALFPTASSFQPDATRLSDDSLNELKALGYIQ